jgi:hypothetical protein
LGTAAFSLVLTESRFAFSIPERVNLCLAAGEALFEVGSEFRIEGAEAGEARGAQRVYGKG